MVAVKPFSGKSVPHPIIRRAKYWYLKILRQEGTPEAIARGWSCGVFSGSFPLFGLQMIIAVLLAAVLKGNKFTAAAGTWISNPFTYVPVFYFNFHVGQIILRKPVTFDTAQLDSWEELSLAGMSVMSTLFIGCTFVGLILGVVVYFLSLWLTHRWQSLRAARRKASKRPHW